MEGPAAGRVSCVRALGLSRHSHSLITQHPRSDFCMSFFTPQSEFSEVREFVSSVLSPQARPPAFAVAHGSISRWKVARSLPGLTRQQRQSDDHRSSTSGQVYNGFVIDSARRARWTRQRNKAARLPFDRRWGDASEKSK